MLDVAGTQRLPHSSATFWQAETALVSFYTGGRCFLEDDVRQSL